MTSAAPGPGPGQPVGAPANISAGPSIALQKLALLATATGVVAPFALPRLLPASASSSPPAGWLSPVATRTPEPLVTAAPSPTSPTVSDALP